MKKIFILIPACIMAVALQAQCGTDITISGNYAVPVTQSSTWIKSSGQTTISNSVSVTLTANATNGYVELKPGSNADYVLSSPLTNAYFLAQVSEICSMAKAQSSESSVTTSRTVPGQEKSNKLVLYPNPAESQVTVIVPIQSGYTAVVTDGHGRTLMQVKSSKGTLQLQVAGLAAGTYFLSIISNDGLKKYQSTFVKQ
jgi:hypothetical protein